MRHILPCVLSMVVALACAAAHAQEAPKTFVGQGASQDAGCAAATQQARDWVKRGKSEGRARQLLEDGTCACTGADGALSCTLSVRTSDAQREEEEER
jgi:predicted transglutaminase-like cysteine proteinase